MRGAKKVMNRRKSVRPKECVFERERESERHLRYYCIVIYPGWSVLCYSSTGETETWHSHQCTSGCVCVCEWERDKIPILGTISCFLCPGSCFCPQDVVEEAILLLLITESMVRCSLTHTHKPQHTHTHTFVFIYLWGHLFHIMLTIQNESLNLTVT